MNWTQQERDLATELIKTFFGTVGSRNVVWDWRDDRYDSWLYIARAAIKFLAESDQ